jgi:hypothetical protein
MYLPVFSFSPGVSFKPGCYLINQDIGATGLNLSFRKWLIPLLTKQPSIYIMAEDKNQPNQLNIELPEEIAEGIYANLAIISHSHSEFVVDFIRMMPNVPKAKVKARVILTPQHAKRLMRALADNIKKFEGQFGAIDESDQNVSFPPMNFNTPKAQA